MFVFRRGWGIKLGLCEAKQVALPLSCSLCLPGHLIFPDILSPMHHITGSTLPTSSPCSLCPVTFKNDTSLGSQLGLGSFCPPPHQPQNTVPGSLPGLPKKAEHFVSCCPQNTVDMIQQDQVCPGAIHGLISPHSQAGSMPFSMFLWSDIRTAMASETLFVPLFRNALPFFQCLPHITLNKVHCCFLWACLSRQHTSLCVHSSYSHHGPAL